MRRVILLSLISSMLFAVDVIAQTAQFSGTVADTSGAVVARATVTVLNKDKGFRRTTLSNGYGNYSVPLLPPGNYMVTVQARGFQTVARDSVVLNVGQAARLDFVLRPGSISETMTIEGGTPLVATESASVGTVVDRQFVANMPLNGRSFQSLVELTPGIIAASTNYNNQGQFNVNGQRADTNYFTIDGASANAGIGSGGAVNSAGAGALPAVGANGGFNNLISIDAMQEFKIQTSTFAPEYGRSPGAQVAIVSRSGTNHISGTLFDYLRNDVFDSNDWFSNRAGLPRSPLRQNDFGGVLGGPILKKKLFFFFSYEGLRLTRPSTEVTFVPSLFARQNAVPSIQPFLNAYPLPTGPVSDTDPNIAQFAGTTSGRNTLDATSIRMDYTINGRMTIFGRFNYAPTNVLSQLSSAQFQTPNLAKTMTLGHTFTITNAVVNDFRLNYTRTTAKSTAQTVSFQGATPVPDSLIFPYPAFQRKSRAQFNFAPLSNLDTLTDGTFGDNRNHQWNLVDTLSWLKGTHELKFGFDWRQLTPKYTGASWGAFWFFNTSSSWFNGVADALGVQTEPGETLRINNFSSFAQDTWKLNSQLTLTYGLRWDLNPGVTSPNGTPPFALANFDPKNPAAMSLNPFGTPAFKTNWFDFAPRLGLAYHLSKDSNWGRVIRAGVGIFYDTAAAAIGFTFGPGATSSINTLTNVSVPPSSSLNLIPPPPSFSPPFFAHTQTTDPKLKMPYVYQFNVALQQQLGDKQSLTTTYVGALGHRLFRTEAFFPQNAVFPCCMWMWRNSTYSNYHSLQIQFERRLSHGLQARTSYTWSHSIDNCSKSTGFGAQNCELTHLAGTDITNDRGSSDFDIRHSFQVGASYNIPPSWQSARARSILAHWSLDVIYRIRSAPPVNVLAGNFVVIVGPAGNVVQFRPDVVPGVPLYISDPTAPGGTRFNPAGFAAIPVDPTTGNATRQGTLPRNALRAYGSQQGDVALRRDFPFTDRYHLELRAEVFNIFNHPSFAPQGSLMTNSSFGTSTSMLAGALGSGNGSNGGNGGFNPLFQIGGARSMQLSLKFHF